MSSIRPLPFVVLLLLTGSAAAEQSSFTLDQVMSAPFPAHLVAAKTGDRVAWVFNDRGVRNVWIAVAPDYQGRKLTSFGEDDGLEIYDLEWTPDGHSLLFVRGGDEDELGSEYPNPRSRTKRPEQAIWIAPLEKGEPKRLAEGHAPRVHPSEDRLVYVKKDQVWWLPFKGFSGNTPPQQQLFEARGKCADLNWSPDGSKLAFVSHRKEHSFVGVYDEATKALRWLDPSVDSDIEPVWSPGGKEVAFLRIPAGRSVVFGPRREGEPWSIRSADVATGQGRAVWTAERGTGSVYRRVTAQHQLLWAAGNRIIFPWERDGWTHLYSVRHPGGAAVCLTPGPFEVEDVVLSQDRTLLYFSSNQNDIDRRHLWSVRVALDQPTAVTTGTGIEWAPVPLERTVAFLHADARQPARPAIKVSASAARDLAPQSMPRDFPASRLVEPEPVTFSAADGLTIHAQLFLPRDLQKGQRRPAVIFFHGGSRRQMLLGWHYMFYYHNSYAFNQYLANRGFVVLSVNYRSGIGYGMEFREALKYGATGASEYADVEGAGLYLRSRPDVDWAKIGLWGGSYGGYLTALGLARASNLFAAGVDIHGVYDWNNEIANWEPTYDPNTTGQRARVAYESSPIAYVKTWRSPVLVIHGDDDRNVPFNESIHLIEDLRKQKVPVEQLIFPDEVHDFLTHERWLTMQKASAAFLERKLQGRALSP